MVGGTGRLGGKIVDLFRRDQPVRVMTRTPSRARAGLDDVDVVQGDLNDHGSLVKALAGADTVVCTAHGGESSGANGPRHVEGAGIPRLIAEASRRSLRQFVYMSPSARPDIPAEFFRLKAAAEQRIRAYGILYSIVRPTHLMDTWVMGLGEPLVKRSRAMILGSDRNPVPFVATDDVARAAASLAGQGGEGYGVDLGGPQTIITELNELIATTFGVTVRRRTRLSAGMLRFASRILRPFNEVTSRQLLFGALLDTQPQVVDSTLAWQRLGITPTTLGDWLHHNAATLAAQWRVPASWPPSSAAAPSAEGH